MKLQQSLVCTFSHIFITFIFGDAQPSMQRKIEIKIWVINNFEYDIKDMNIMESSTS